MSEPSFVQGPRPTTFFGRPANVLYFGTHFLLDEARHTGQIVVAREHGLPNADPAFGPHVGRSARAHRPGPTAHPPRPSL